MLTYEYSCRMARKRDGKIFETHPGDWSKDREDALAVIRQIRSNPQHPLTGTLIRRLVGEPEEVEDDVPDAEIVFDTYEYAAQYYEVKYGHVADIGDDSWLKLKYAQEEVDSHLFLPDSPVQVRLVRRLKEDFGGTGKVEIVE